VKQSARAGLRQSRMKPKRETICRMFGEIAPRYDLLNRLLTLDNDRAWRREAAALVPPARSRIVLDVGAGSGEHPDTSRLLAADFSESMLQRAQWKQANSSRVRLVRCDAMQLPWRTGQFDGVMAAFAIRNFVDLQAGLQEMARVLRPGGWILVLEMCGGGASWPVELFRRHFVPVIGGILTGRGDAYRYLAQSTAEFLSPQQLTTMLETVGFEQLQWKVLKWGIATAITGIRAEK